MKKLAILFLFLFTVATQLSAHNLWLETEATGTIGEAQQIHVYYGEYTYDYYEEVDGNFTDVENFDLWVIAPDGKKIKLNTSAGQKRYTAEFTPRQNGQYTIFLQSTKNEVVDWREYDLGILKPNFYASTSFQVGNGSETSKHNSNTTALTIKDHSSLPHQAEQSTELSVLFNGEAVAEQEVIVSIADQWTKTIYTDENGKVSLTLPWDEQYVIEVIYTEEQAGSFQGTEFEAIRHTATHTIQAQ